MEIGLYLHVLYRKRKITRLKICKIYEKTIIYPGELNHIEINVRALTGIKMYVLNYAQ